MEKNSYLEEVVTIGVTNISNTKNWVRRSDRCLVRGAKELGHSKWDDTIKKQKTKKQTKRKLKKKKKNEKKITCST